MNLSSLALDSSDGVITSFRLRNQVILRSIFEKTVKSCIEDGKDMVVETAGNLSYHTQEEVLDMVGEGIPSNVHIFLVGISHNPTETVSTEENYFATLQQF